MFLMWQFFGGIGFGLPIFCCMYKRRSVTVLYHNSPCACFVQPEVNLYVYIRGFPGVFVMRPSTVEIVKR